MKLLDTVCSLLSHFLSLSCSIDARLTEAGVVVIKAEPVFEQCPAEKKCGPLGHCWGMPRKNTITLVPVCF